MYGGQQCPFLPAVVPLWSFDASVKQYYLTGNAHKIIRNTNNTLVFAFNASLRSMIYI